MGSLRVTFRLQSCSPLEQLGSRASLSNIAPTVIGSVRYHENIPITSIIFKDCEVQYSFSGAILWKVKCPVGTRLAAPPQPILYVTP